MLQKLKDISSALLLPAFVLYFFGFVCITSFLSRFGFVTFEALNSRFVIAGIYPLIALVIVLYLAWYLFSNLPPSKFFGLEGWSTRWKTHFNFFVLVLAGSSLIYLLMQVGRYRKPLAQEYLTFNGVLGKYDYIGDLITRLPLDISVSANFVIQLTLYVFSYLFLVAIAVYLLVLITRMTRINSKTTDTEPKPSERTPVETAPIKAYWEVPVLLIDVLIISFYTALAFYASFKLGVELFDYQSLISERSLSLTLIFAWVYSSIITVYLFLFNFEVPPEQLQMDLRKHLTSYGSMQFAGHQLVVPLLASLFFFGATIFPLIPFSIGGGQPRRVDLTLKRDVENFPASDTFLLGESSQYLFIVSENGGSEAGKSWVINKDAVVYMQIHPPHIRTSPPVPSTE